MSRQPDDSPDEENGQPQDTQPRKEQPQGGQPRREQSQNNQPQGGQPRGGRSQNNQPQGGQPRGGRSQNNQPQGGQPPGGQPQNSQPQGGRGWAAETGGARAQQQYAGYGQSELVDFAKFGVLAYGIAALGTLVTLFFAFALAGDGATITGSGQFGNEELFAAAVSGGEMFVSLAALLAVAIGVYYHVSEDVTGPTYTPTVVAALAGTAVATILLLLLSVLFAPDAADPSFGDELTGVIGLLIGTAITGALVGFALDNVMGHQSHQ